MELQRVGSHHPRHLSQGSLTCRLHLLRWRLSAAFLLQAWQCCVCSRAANQTDPRQRQVGSVSCTAIEYWHGHKDDYPSLAPVALDLVSAPASQAYTERIFSVWGDLTAGKRNRTKAALQRWVFLKSNWKFLHWRHDCRLLDWQWNGNWNWKYFKTEITLAATREKQPMSER